MSELFVSAFVTLFVVIDPPGCAPIFASLTGGATPAQRTAMAWRAVLTAAAILLFFALLGEQLLRALGISLDAFRIAGGVLLFLIAADMVFEKRTQRREQRAASVAEQAQARQVEVADVSVFPMAIPMIAGPGSIASIMLLMARADNPAETGAVLGAAALVLALTLLALLAAGPLMRLVGEKVEAMVTRLLGVILCALAAQIVVDGVKGAFAL
ncbi:MAG: MarC family protein [Sphingomonadaceae bacterium]